MVCERDLHAKMRSLVRAQARTTNDTYISSSSDFSERNKVIELEGRVVSTMSPISCVLVSAEVLGPCVPTITRAANSLSMFWEALQCSNNPWLFWQGGNIISEFPAPRLLQHSVASALINPWTVLLTYAALQAFAASLLDQDCAHLINVERNDPLWSQPLAEAPGPPPEPSRLPAPHQGALASSLAMPEAPG